MRTLPALRRPPLGFVMLACLLVFLVLGDGVALFLARPDWSSPAALAGRFVGLGVLVLSATVVAALLVVPPWTPRLVAWWAGAVLGRVAAGELARGGEAGLAGTLLALLVLALVLGAMYLYVRGVVRTQVHPAARPVPHLPAAP